MKKWHILFTCLALSAAFVSCKLGRFVVYNFADIKDYKKFPDRKLNKSETTFQFPASESPRAPKNIHLKGDTIPFETFLEENNTVAFIVLKNDSLLYEKYFNKYDESSVVASFSMAKSVTSMLIGCAIEDGFIQSVEEPVTNYIPELKENGFDSVTIEHLLQMTSGLDYNESYINPFGDAATYYYGRHLRKAVTKLKLEHPPGTHFEYQSGSTQVLGLILDRALKDKTLTEYLEEKIWLPLGMEYDASWSIDKKKDGLEKTFCCLNARARDFAKLGELYLHQGNWQGQQLVPETWVEQSTKIDTTNGSKWYYQYQWWLPTQTGDFMAQGYLGQYIYVYPERDIVIVRLGKNNGDADWWTILSMLGHAYK
ncbi:MAG: serine hydrolase [Crocinitomicaceae bacterium]|nr:serine hydrolase [Crocinitomicaceae bacterium]